jgi:hypothetical protein
MCAPSVAPAAAPATAPRFAGPVWVDVGATPVRLITVDLDADGALDLVSVQ